MTTPPKDDSTRTSATSSNGSATANNASPAPSASSNFWIPPKRSELRQIARIPQEYSSQRRYAPTPDGQPPNGGIPPGIYAYGNFILGVPEPPLAAPIDGTQADQPLSSSSSSQAQNAHREPAGKGQNGSK